MGLHKRLLEKGFLLPQCEKHFHDSDETWIILKGKGLVYEVDRKGNRSEFEVEAGDVWMIEVGHEHGGKALTPDFKVAVFLGTQASGAQKPSHQYIEKEGYVPSFKLIKTPTDRYKKGKK